MSEVEAATFDCYGTLVDWEGGLGTFLYGLCRRAGEREPPPGRELRQRWERIQYELVRDGDYKPYASVIEDATRTLAGELGLRWNELEATELAHAMGAWQPFADTVPALAAARRAGLRLAIVSNTDRGIIAHTLRQLDGVEFDEVVVAEDVRAYKPHGRGLQKAIELLGCEPASIVHVAFGFDYDIPPAKKLGMSTAWVNRHREPLPNGAEAPDHEWNDLWPLAELAAKPRAPRPHKPGAA